MSSFRFYFAPIARDFPRIEAAAFIFPVFRTVHTLRRFYVAFLHSVPRLFTGVLPVRRLGFRRLFFCSPAVKTGVRCILGTFLVRQVIGQ